MSEQMTYEMLEQRVRNLEQANAEYQKTIDSLKKSEALFNSLLENSPIYVFFKDENIQSIRLSRNYEQMIGRPLEELYGKSMNDLFPSDLAEKMVADDKKIINEGKPVNVDEEFDGRYYTTAKFPISIDQKKYLAGYTIDITEQKKAEEALRRSEDLLRSIYRAAPTGIGVVSNRVILSVNDRVCEMTGYAKEDLVGKDSRFLYPSGKEYEYVGKEKYRQIGEIGTGTLETRWLRRDGTIIDVLMSSTPLDPQDLTEGVTYTALDITERKKAENELRRSHQMFLTVLEGIDATVYVTDMATHKILYMNKQMIHAAGGDHTGGLCYRILHGRSGPCNNCTIEQLLDEDGNPEEVCVWEAQNLRSKKWYSNHDRAIQWLDGRIVKLQIAFDITTLKETELRQNKIAGQLIQAQKMESVGRLAGGVAHDYNNMLGAILGFTELGIADTQPGDSIHALLHDIREAALRSASLTKQLLTFARRQTVAPQVLDLNEVVEGLLKMLRQLIGENVTLTWKPGNHSTSIRVDPSQLEQVLVNLCVNARDAIFDTGEICVETDAVSIDEAYCTAHLGSYPGDYVMLVVRDNGCGMDAETLSHVFEPFFTTKEVGKGTGLGLATVYGMVKQNDGYIEVDSQPGKGTTFKIYLPQEVVESEIATPPPELIPSKNHGDETILLVEDEPMILKIAAKMLEYQGYQVLKAPVPSEAIRIASEHAGEIHLLMTDMVMPEMNGRDLSKNLLSLRPNIKRLFMSGYTADIIAHHGVLEGSVQFLQKPFSMESLAEKVRMVLDDTEMAAKS